MGEVASKLKKSGAAVLADPGIRKEECP